MQESSPFRSEQMSLVQLYVPLEIAPQTVSELGELGMIEFNDVLIRFLISAQQQSQRISANIRPGTQKTL